MDACKLSTTCVSRTPAPPLMLMVAFPRHVADVLAVSWQGEKFLRRLKWIFKRYTGLKGDWPVQVMTKYYNLEGVARVLEDHRKGTGIPSPNDDVVPSFEGGKKYHTYTGLEEVCNVLSGGMPLSTVVVALPAPNGTRTLGVVYAETNGGRRFIVPIRFKPTDASVVRPGGATYYKFHIDLPGILPLPAPAAISAFGLSLPLRRPGESVCMFYTITSTWCELRLREDNEVCIQVPTVWIE